MGHLPVLPLHLSWVTIVVVPLEIGLVLTMWFRGPDLFGRQDQPLDHVSQMLWPLKVSNYLVLFSIVLYIVACLRHPPLGSYRSVALFVWLPLLGLMLRRWEQ